MASVNAGTLGAAATGSDLDRLRAGAAAEVLPMGFTPPTGAGLPGSPALGGGADAGWEDLRPRSLRPHSSSASAFAVSVGGASLRTLCCGSVGEQGGSVAASTAGAGSKAMLGGWLALFAAGLWETVNGSSASPVRGVRAGRASKEQWWVPMPEGVCYAVLCCVVLSDLLEGEAAGRAREYWRELDTFHLQSWLLGDRLCRSRQDCSQIVANM